ncbi:SpoIIE family protein phosphatase [Streptomyces sp. NBC_01800]|uniref:SpoIIE family protein phosphatase n=1 Tax=Streptomyces sp. NBC_01800 TaxID=2975945 RepID=UPI002DDC3035|nr:SpoIIE family protein phosphatase [Streptomyces sp. NBC_01800]WSA65642.1 SpoIIE family protein phosphatase [Streptomyces sp. NBC_01800]WSA73475.1 SpoIIE family protein phosphatase [Streptomyces sp. NBC_01800]
MSIPQDSSSQPDRELDDAVLTTLFSETRVGLHVLDTELRLVRYNSAARNIRAFPLEEFLGRRFTDVLRTYDVAQADAIEAMVTEVLETGRPRRDVLVTVRSRRDPFAQVVASVSWFRLTGEGRRPLGVAGTIMDVTDRYRAHARLALLDRAAARIGSTLDLFRTAQELADVTVPELADTVTVDLLDLVLRGEAPEPGPLIENLPMRRAGRRVHESAESSEVYPVGDANAVSAGTPYRWSMADLRPRLIGRLDADAEWLSQDPVRARVLLGAGVHSMMVVPLLARGVVLGLVCFYRGQCPDAYEDDDLALAVQLAARTAVCLDNARLYGRERSAGQLLQLSLRPREVPVHTAVETAHSYVPSGAGGDWFDVIPLSGARVALVAGDTPGRGIRAAAAMGELRAAIGALASLDLPPDELLDRLHELVTRLGSREPWHDGPDSRTVGTTCLYLVYDPRTLQCNMARAGHPPPVIALPDGTVQLADIPQGPPLGHGLPAYQSVERELPEGSTLVLYNTALYLHSSAQHDGQRLDGIRTALASDNRSLQEACDAVLDGLAPERPEDDVVLLFARTRVLDTDHLVSWTLRPAPEVVAEARKLAAGQLAAWGLDDLEYTTSLVVSELVTNALRYSDGPIGLRLIRDRALICEVSDTSSTSPQLRHAADTDEGGRGLYLTAQMTQRWGTRPDRRGKTIWAEQELP